jgi:hypothetical protein
MNNETLMELKMMISGGFHNFFDVKTESKSKYFQLKTQNSNGKRLNH